MKSNQFWWMLSFLALAALLALLFFIVIPAHGGTPVPKCPIEGHQGPVCHMDSCRAIKDGKPIAGSNCSQYCAKTCCGCKEGVCPMEHNQLPSGDEEYLQMGFGD